MANIRDYQIRVNSLGVLQEAGKPPLVVDGISGSKTIEGLSLAKQKLGVRNNEDIMHKSGITRVHWHWTAGTYYVTSDTTSHYNGVFGHDGKYYPGGRPAIEQAKYSSSRGVGVSHTYRANTGAIGLSVAGMHGAEAHWGKGKVDPGDYPMTWAAIDAMLRKTKEYCELYDIYPSPWTTLSHAEVEGNIGIKQRGKWDICTLPDLPWDLLPAREAGDILRERMENM